MASIGRMRQVIGLAALAILVAAASLTATYAEPGTPTPTPTDSAVATEDATRVASPINWDYEARTANVPILMYHYVAVPPAKADKYLLDLAVTPENFAAQVKWLKDQGYKSITPNQLMGALWLGTRLPKKPIMFTFDDGYDNAYGAAFPILKQAGFTGTFFVVTDWVDAAKPGYITWPMARAMVQGGMLIENHSRTHEDFRNRSHDWYVNEIVEPMKDIQKQTGVRPLYLAYPYGGYDNVAINELQAAGVIAAFTENDSRYEFAANTYRMPRIRVRGSFTLDQFIGAVTDDR